MKITIPSRAGAVGPQEASASTVPATHPQASSSATATGASTSTSATSTSTPRIRIKQGGGGGSAATSSASASALAAANASTTEAAGQIKGEEDGIAIAAVETNVASPPTPPPSKEVGSSAINTSLILPGKRKRTSLLPSNANNNASSSSAANADGKLHQTRGGATQEEIDKAYEEGMKLWQILKEHQKKDGRPMSTEFMHLPARDNFPDYYQMIKKPISFTEIRNKLERREYGTNPNPTSNTGILKLISDDFKQMFFNAKRYNIKGSLIYNDARKLDRLHRQTYARLAGLIVPTEEDDENAAGNAGGIAEGGENEDIKGSATPVPSSTAGLASAGTSQAQNAQQQPPKKKHKKAAQQQIDDKPITLTKWLSMKVDDLVAMTDKSGRVLSEVFMQVPPQSSYPDYYQVISKPISFQLVRSRLKNRNYQTIEKFKDDINLIFSNAQFYNEEGSQIWQDANEMKDYFNNFLMKDDPPEFFVRPRNQSQQAVSSSSRPGEGGNNQDQPKLRYASNIPGQIGGNSYSFSYPSSSSTMVQDASHNLGGGSFAMPAQNAYDTVKFGEFDEHDAAVEHDSHMDVFNNTDTSMDQQQQQRGASSSSPAKAEGQARTVIMDTQQQSQQAPNIPVPSTAPYPHLQQFPSQTSTPSISVPQQQSQLHDQQQTSHLAPAFSQVAPAKLSTSPAPTATGPKPKLISRLVDPNKPPIIGSFTIALFERASSLAPLLIHHIPNTLVRQHCITVSKEVRRLEILPVLTSTSATSIITYKAIGRFSSQLHVNVMDGSSRIIERHWSVFDLRSGLTTVEIFDSAPRAGEENAEVYRIYVNKLVA